MKILLFNDTRVETNPGCHATVTALSDFIMHTIPEAIIGFKPLGLEYDIFPEGLYKESNPLLQNRYVAKLLLKLKWTKSKKIIDFNLWKHNTKNNLSKATIESIKKSDLIVVNMEGTIHHNSTGGFALLAIAYYSKKLGKPVAMVNGSYQDFDLEITKKVLSSIDFLAVRETESLSYLKRIGVEALLMPDFAFKAQINSKNLPYKYNSRDFNIDKKKCLYSVGVLGVYPNQKNGINWHTIKKHITEIKDLGYKPFYLKIEAKEVKIASALNDLGVGIISYEDGIDYKNIGNLLLKFDLLITGRYHIGIFGLMNYIPTFFLKSNTYKIEGLLDMLKLKTRMIENHDVLKTDFKIDKSYQLPNDNTFFAFRDFLLKQKTKN